jgi:formylmethanofuran dehydrogenase subunit E
MESSKATEYPEDFMQCVNFHGHVCPGLAIGYAAVKAAGQFFEGRRASDEELVAIVENDSCAVDAVQVLAGCTFGKGNLIFRDWGKQVFTFMDRASGTAVRVSFNGLLPSREERHALRAKIDAGTASREDKERFEQLRDEAVQDLIGSDPTRFFEVQEVGTDLPPSATIVETTRCTICGEPTMSTRMVSGAQGEVCKGCATEGKQ